MEFLKLDADKIIEEYKLGASLRGLASKYGTSKQTIKKRLEKQGINIKSSAEYIQDNRNKFIKNSNPFKKKRKISFSIYENELQKTKFSEFLKKASIKHGGKFDYSTVEYKNYNKPIIIICPVHGPVKVLPNFHLMNKYGCLLCSEIARKKEIYERFLKKLDQVHDGKYDYSKFVGYANIKSKITVVCPKHGEFYPTLKNHLNGSGCKKCTDESKKSNTNEFISKACDVHKLKFGYDKVDYKESKKPVIITCKIHGDFLQRPNSHLNGHGCPQCAKDILISKAHCEIAEFIKNMGLGIKMNDRTIISPLELDIVVDNVAIEYNGLFWHSFDRQETKEDRYKHYVKTDLCHDKGIKLLQIFENEWIYKQTIVKSILRNKLGKCLNRIYARKCSTAQLSSKEFNSFCHNNHLQGSLSTKFCIGLTYNGELVSVLGLNRHLKYQWEITRFCNKLNVNVIGGASKLFSHFIKSYNPSAVMTYVDRRYSDGRLYQVLGFKLNKITTPGYFYVDYDRLLNRRRYQKHKLFKVLDEYDDKLTEAQNMFNNGYRRIWDAGHYKFIWQK